MNQARAIPRLQVPALVERVSARRGRKRNDRISRANRTGRNLRCSRDSRDGDRTTLEARIKHAQDVRAGAQQHFRRPGLLGSQHQQFSVILVGAAARKLRRRDPFLTARMGVAFVTGMQGDDRRYYGTISTPKHFAVHSGPESTRHQADVKLASTTNWTHIFPRSARHRVTEAKAGSVMRPPITA